MHQGDFQAPVKAMARLPTQLRADPGGIDRIAPVVARAIAHSGDQLGMGGTSGLQLIEQRADRLNHLLVVAFPMAPHTVAAARLTPACGRQQRIHVILHIEPVAHIEAIAIERDRLTGYRLEDHHRDQLLRKLPGAVVIRAIG